MARKKKITGTTPQLKPKKKKPEVEEIRDVVQKGITTGSQVADFVFDIIKLFS
jgi:hypothetical protein